DRIETRQRRLGVRGTAERFLEVRRELDHGRVGRIEQTVAEDERALGLADLRVEAREQERPVAARLFARRERREKACAAPAVALRREQVGRALRLVRREVLGREHAVELPLRDLALSLLLREARDLERDRHVVGRELR